MPAIILERSPGQGITKRPNETLLEIAGSLMIPGKGQLVSAGNIRLGLGLADTVRDNTIDERAERDDTRNEHQERDCADYDGLRAHDALIDIEGTCRAADHK